jgi:two-component system cell cycle response regulator
MSTLERTVLLLRKGWRLSSVYLFAGAYAAIFIHGSFANFWESSVRKIAIIILFGAWVVVFGVKAHRRFAGSRNTDRSVTERVDLELGLLLVVGIYAAAQAAGGLSSLVYPVIFVLMAFLVVYTPQWVGFTLAATAIGIEFAIAAFGPQGISFYEGFIHSLFIVFFALINLVSTRAGIARMQRCAEKMEAEAKAARADDARAFRIIAPAKSRSGRDSRQEEVQQLTDSSMNRLKSAMHHHVALLKRTMKLNTCAVLWLDANGENLMVKQCISDMENVITKPFNKGEGVLGAVLKHRKPLRLEGLRPGYGGLIYYAEPVAVTDFIGIPILEGDNLMGVLCADRMDGRPFEHGDVEAMEASVESLLSIISNERMFNQLQKAKSEQGNLLMASEVLSRNLGEQDVVKAALNAAGQIVHFELGAVALVTEDGDQVVCEAAGPKSEGLVGVVVSATESLAAAALKNRHYLPYRGELDPKQQILLSKHSQGIFAKMHSAMVLPLSSGDTSFGTLILASSQENVFDEEVRTTLQVMTNQLGTVLENARMYQKLKELATTDGLTGLPNHRIFQEALDKKIASSTRFGNNLSLIFCDVDHFKNVNDTYGHPVGDLVLKRLSTILKKEVVRDTDLPARYGGEEFAIICEGTDTEGAVKLAERIRRDFEEEVFHTDQGTLKVTISMGIATCPIHARQKEELIERADTALYAAKEGGRNQVRTWKKGMLPQLLHK